MKYLLCYILLVKTLEKSIRNSRGNVTPEDSRDVMNNVTRTVKCPSLFQSDVLSITKISAVGCTNRFRVIFHMPRRLTKVDVIFICFLLFYHIELYINKILRSCTYIIFSIAFRDFVVTTFTQAGQNS